MNTSELWIGGKEQKSSTGEYFDDLNPSNSALIARVAKGNADDVDAAVSNAKETFEHFKDSEVRQREKILCDAASLVDPQGLQSRCEWQGGAQGTSGRRPEPP